MNISDFLKIYKILINWFQTINYTTVFAFRLSQRYFKFKTSSFIPSFFVVASRVSSEI